MPRQRMTWKQADQGKQASPPPQIPAVDRTEGPDSPAYYPDPAMDKYENGDTSSWAEDPHSPMSPESPPPAMPGNLTTDKLTHPGTSEFSKTPESPEKAMADGGGGGKKQASLKELAEQRATLCVRIASALMPGAEAVAVENKALELMDLDDGQLRATANTLKLIAGEDEVEVDEEEEIEVEGSKKKGNLEVTARLDKIESSMGKLVKAMGHFFGMGDDDMSDKELMAYLMAEDSDGDGIDQSKNDFPQGYDVDKLSGEDEFERGEESEGTSVSDEAMGDKMGMDDEESMLRAMLEEMDQEMAMTASSKRALESEDNQEPLAKGPTIQSGEGGNVNPDKYAPTPVVAQSDGAEKVGDPTPHGSKSAGDAENDIVLTAGADPMGLMDEPPTKAASADDELMQLYADLDLPKTAGEEEDEEEEEIEIEIEGGKKKATDDDDADDQDEASDEDDDAKMAAKKAGRTALKPQPKAASKGAQKLGNVSGMPKAAADEMDQLSKLWESAPDVSSVFGVPSSS